MNPMNPSKPTTRCAEVKEAVAAGEPIPELDAHLDACDACRAFAEDVRELRALARALPRPERPLASQPAVAGTPLRRWLPLALAAVVVVALGWALLAGKGPGAGNPQPPTPAAERLDLLACLDEAAEVWEGEEDWSVQEWLGLPGEPQPLFAEQQLLRRLHRSSLLDAVLDGSNGNKNNRR
jgi:hypothetical protein